jgi:hypothetical protein
MTVVPSALSAAASLVPLPEQTASIADKDTRRMFLLPTEVASDSGMCPARIAGLAVADLGTFRERIEERIVHLVVATALSVAFDSDTSRERTAHLVEQNFGTPADDPYNKQNILLGSYIRPVRQRPRHPVYLLVDNSHLL